LRNKLKTIKHILGITKKAPAKYYLKNGLVFFSDLDKKDRTLVLTFDEIFGKKIYKLDKDPGKDLIILDIGANVGVYSLYCSLYYDVARIYAYEPHPEAFSQLERNIKINNMAGKICPIKKAITGSDGQDIFYQDEESSRGSSTMRKFDKQFTVQTLSLAGIFKELDIQHCDIAKIDIEGSEYPSILNCSGEVLRNIKTILIECHEDFASSNARYTKKEIRAHLENSGFTTIRDEGLMLIVTLKT